MRYRIGMKFAQETSPTAKLVTRYGADGLWIGDQHHTTSVIVTPTTVTPWAARSVADLTTQDLDAVLAMGVELILLATGLEQQFPAPALMYHAMARRVGIEVMNLGGAARTYNVLVGDGRPVALAVLLG
jgi:uncharacterized protein